jgi:hypothetical protein
MSYVNYILEAYPIEYEFEDSEVTAIEVKEKYLGKVLSYLSRKGFLRSQPAKQAFKTLYRIYVIGDIGRYLDELKDFEVEVGGGCSLDSLPRPDSLKAEIAYIALRNHLYKRGFKRGAGSKLYNPGKPVTPPNLDVQGLELYKAVVTGLDVLSKNSYLFVDAARKIEFTKSMQELESLNPRVMKGLDWLKVIGSPTSFLVSNEVKLSDLPKEVSEETALIAEKVLKYLYETGRIDKNVADVEVSRDNLYEYGLLPRSTRLKKELLEEGLLLTIGGKSVRALFLPKNVLTPVASYDNLRRISPDAPAKIFEELHLPPRERHNEITDFLKEVSQTKIPIEGLHLTINLEPLACVNVTTFKHIYVEGWEESSGFSFFTRWDPYAKLRQYSGRIKLYLLEMGGDGSSVASVKEQLERKLQSRVNYSRFEDENEFFENLENVVKEILEAAEPYKAVIVFGPPDVDEWEDKRLRNRVEYEFISRGIFCRYLSRIVRDGVKLSDMLSYKMNTVLKALAITLGILSHKLKKLEISVRDGYKHVVSNIVGIDATTVGMEKGKLRVAVAILIVDLAENSFNVKSLTELSDEGEDAVIAETMKRVVSGFTPDGAPLLIYVNRARPEAMISYHLDEDTVRELFEKAVIVGATKTHNYSRILKVSGKGKPRLVNPEVGVYYPLHEGEEAEVVGEKVRLAKYLAVTTTVPGESRDLTIKPVLFTIIAGGKYKGIKYLEKYILDYSLTLSMLNNTSVWTHSLPWPIHEVDRKLKTAHRVAPDEKDVLGLLQNESILRIL